MKKLAISSRALNILYLSFILSVIGVSINKTHAQSLADWEKALKSKKDGPGGRETIPYSNLYSTAKFRQSDVINYCKESNWTCDGLETKSFRQDIVNLSNYIDKVKNDLNQLNIDKSKAQTDTQKKEIQSKINETILKFENKTRELEFKKKSLETDISDIGIRIGRGANCINARIEVQKAFNDAIERAGKETDLKIKPIADELISYWKKENKGHEEAIKTVNVGITKCKKCKDGQL